MSLDASSFLIYNPPEAANVEFQQDVWLMGEFYNGSHDTAGTACVTVNNETGCTVFHLIISASPAVSRKEYYFSKITIMTQL